MDTADQMAIRWMYKERQITGPYARVVFDVKLDWDGGTIYVLRDVKDEVLASYICALHNNLVDTWEKFGFEQPEDEEKHS